MFTFDQIKQLSELLSDGAERLKKSWFDAEWDYKIKQFEKAAEKFQKEILAYVANPYKQNQALPALDHAKLVELNVTCVKLINIWKEIMRTHAVKFKEYYHLDEAIKLYDEFAEEDRRKLQQDNQRLAQELKTLQSKIELVEAKEEQQKELGGRYEQVSDDKLELEKKLQTANQRDGVLLSIYATLKSQGSAETKVSSLLAMLESVSMLLPETRSVSANHPVRLFSAKPPAQSAAAIKPATQSASPRLSKTGSDT